jgi:hypothetical protein
MALVVGNVQLAAATRAAAAMLVLAALVIAAAAVDDQPAFGTAASHHGRLPLMGLTSCVAVCGRDMTTCWLGCYQPVVGGEVVKLSVCLLSCTNNATTCVSGCATKIA